MALLRTKWTPEAAEEWTREDLVACVLSCLAYLALTVGTALTFLLQVKGFIILGAGVVFSLWLYAVIDPKLRTISDNYEGKQREYLKRLEKLQRWGETE